MLRAHLPCGRARRATGIVALSACALTACSLLVDADADQCARDQDCASFGDGRACVDGLCVRLDGAAADAAEDAADGLDAPGSDVRPDAGIAADAGTAGDAPATAPDAEDGAVEPEGAPPAPALDAALANAWADEAVENLMLNFWRQSLAGGYLSSAPKGATATSYWTFAQAWEAVIDAVERHQGNRFMGTLRTLYLAQDAQGWSSPSFADENWMTLALTRAHDVTQDSLYDYESSVLYPRIMNAWDTTCCLQPGGGIWTDQAHSGKDTAVNAGAVINGSRLFVDRTNIEFLQYAQMVFDYWSANMVDATTHHVADSVAADGTKTASKLTYDEGLMIGAGVALAGATTTTAPLDVARAAAQFLLAEETGASPYGPVLSDVACTGDCQQYKGIAARYLGQLYAVDPAAHPEYLALLKASAIGAHELARDPVSGVYAADWGRPYASQTAPPLLDATSAAATLFSAVASLLGPPVDPPGVYQGEEAVLHGVGVEAKYLGFEGWGYVAGWDDQGQVDFLIDVPDDGQYDLTLRYAADGGTAARLASINGAALPILMFPETGSWEKYGTQTITVSLVAGQSTFTLASNPSAGTYNPLNLDSLTVAPH